MPEEVLSWQRMFLPKPFDNVSPCLGDAQKVDMRSDFPSNNTMNGSTSTVLALLLYRRYSPRYYYNIDPILLPSENLFKCHEKVLSLQPKFLSKRFDIFFPGSGDAQKA